MNSATKEKSGRMKLNESRCLCEDFFRFGKGILGKLIETVCEIVPDKQSTSILDIGTGNGHVIQRLLRRGYTNLAGIDYSDKSIELARAQISSNVPFEVVDLTASDTSKLGQFDIGIDKGTLDASLLCSSDERKAKREAYVETIHRHINNLLFLVSCNWTRNELIQFFEPSKIEKNFHLLRIKFLFILQNLHWNVKSKLRR